LRAVLNAEPAAQGLSRSAVRRRNRRTAASDDDRRLGCGLRRRTPAINLYKK